jgi:WD40 repeat protein
VVPLNCTEYNHSADTMGTCTPSSDFNVPGVNDAAITDLAFSLDGRYLFSAGNDGRVKVWTWNGTTLVPEGTPLETDSFTYLAQSPDGRRLAAGSRHGNITVWNLADFSVVATLTGVTADIYGLVFSPDSSTLYTIDAGGSLTTFTTMSMAAASTMSFSPLTPYVLAGSTTESDGTYWLAVGYDDGDASIFNVDAGSFATEIDFSVTPSFTDATWTLQFSHDGRFLAGGAQDGSLGIWPVPLTGPNPISPGIAITASYIDAVAFSPSGASLAVAAGKEAGDALLGVWDVASGAMRARVQNLTYRPYSVAYTIDGSTIAAGMRNCGRILICPVN